MRTPTLPLALVLLAPTAGAQEALDGTYHFARLGAWKDQECVQDEIITNALAGTITFLPGGTLTASGTELISCSAGATTGGPFFAALTYTLDKHGLLVIDNDPSSPGTDTDTMRVSWDRELILSVEDESGDPGFLVAIRAGSGLSDAVLAGDYAWAGATQDRLTTGIVTRIDLGALAFGGAGATAQSSAWKSIDSNGETSGMDPSAPGTYSVASDGSLALSGGLTGAVTDDGRFGFAVELNGSRTGLRVFVNKPTQAPTPGALDDLWRYSEYGADLSSGFPCAGVEPESSSGQVVFDALTGGLVHASTEVWTDCTGGGSAPDSGTGTFVLAPSGAITVDPGQPDSTSGWLAASEDVGLYAVLNDTDSAYFGVLQRDWGPLATNVDALSVSGGGTQTMTIRAGKAHAGRAYLVLGTLSGTYPGLTVAGLTIPLNFDPYTQHTLASPNQAPLGQSLGVLGAKGEASATFTIPPGLNPAFVGQSACHAVAVLDLLNPSLLVLASNAAGLDLLP